MRPASAAALRRFVAIKPPLHTPRPPHTPSGRVGTFVSAPDALSYRSVNMLAGPIFSRSQSHFSQETAPEYVSDSEPEREERRIRQKSRGKQKRVEAPIPPLSEVIELTDSDASYHAPLLGSPRADQPHVPQIVIDISDSGEDPSPHVEQDAVKINGGNSAQRETHGTPFALEDVTTDDSLPSIARAFGLPKRNPAKSIPVNPVPEREKSPDPERASPRSPTGSAGESTDDEGPLKLSRFAYAASNPIRRTVSKTPSPTDTGGSVPPEQTASKAKRVASHRFAGDFNDGELSRILKCVSCDLAWTTRKTVPQKMKHIQSCAKKNGLTDDTVRTLLRKELDSLPPVASSSKSGTPGPASATPPVPETLLEEVVKDGSKKKPGRRPQVLQTVKSVTETRDTILDKARSLLQTDGPSRASSVTSHNAESVPSHTALEVPPATQMFSTSNVAARSEPAVCHQADVTHVFGPSRLAGPSSRLQGAVVRAGAEIAAQSDVSPLTQGPVAPRGEGTASSAIDDFPPPTQAFARSNLTNRLGVTRRIVAAAADDPPDDPISLHDTSEDDLTRSSPPRPTTIRPPPSSSVNPLPHSRPTSPRADAHPTPSPAPLRQSPPPAGDIQPPADFDVGQDDYHDHWNDWRNDDVWNEDGGACLHYIPETPGAGPSRLPAQDQVQEKDRTASPLRRRLATILEDSSVPGPSTGTDPPAPSQPPPAKKRTRRKKVVGEDSDTEAGATKAADISQDELNAKMKEAIMKDEALYLRILRYEPIHFDVFLQMAVDLGIPAKRSGLRGKVRAFLDQKAIHFYGADPSKSRTRRTRHP